MLINYYSAFAHMHSQNIEQSEDQLIKEFELVSPHFQYVLDNNVVNLMHGLGRYLCLIALMHKYW